MPRDVVEAAILDDTPLWKIIPQIASGGPVLGSQRLAFGQPLAANTVRVGRPVIVGIRPEDLTPCAPQLLVSTGPKLGGG